MNPLLQEVEAICDRVVIINKGKLVADDTLSVLRNQSQDNLTVKVQFKETIDVSLLKAIPGVESVSKINSNEWELLCANANDVKRLLLELSLQHNLNIVSLQSGEQRLEEVFRNLTNPGKE
jgi:ABC-2 type transport system ATP-binding protein